MYWWNTYICKFFFVFVVDFISYSILVVPFKYDHFCVLPLALPLTNKILKYESPRRGGHCVMGPINNMTKKLELFQCFSVLFFFFFSNLLSLKIILTFTIKLLSHGAGLKITLHLLPCKLHSWPNFQLRFLLFESCSKKCDLLFLLKLPWDIFLQEIKPIL